MEVVQEKAKYLVLNCQTNSSNKGMNIITKYARADVFTLDQQELAVAEWFDRKKMPAHNDGISLTREMMGFFEEKEVFDKWYWTMT